MVLWGDYVESFPRWAPRLEACGVRDGREQPAAGLERSCCPKIGIRGNSHMLMQDENSLQIAEWLLAWLDRNAERRARH